MAAINDSIKGIWNEWKRQYDTATDPGAKKTALENLKALDIADDGQKNNSLDKSMNLWEIQDPPSGQGGGSGSGLDVGPSGAGGNQADFDKLMNSLPHEINAKVHEWFGGHDKVINTDSERTEALEYLRSKAGTDNILSEEERDAMHKELDTYRVQWDQLNRLMQQLPMEVQNKIREKFDGSNDWFDANEIADALKYIQSKTNNNPNPTTAEIDALKKDLGL